MESDPGASPSDEELMLNLQRGDDTALAGLMGRWEVPVKRFIFRIVGNPNEAEDLAQEVFLRVYTRKASFRNGAKFSTWCFSIAANQARDRLRWWRRRPTLSLDAWSESGGDLPDSSNQGGQPSDQAMRREQIELVRRAVSALPVDLRTALVLFEYEQQSVSDIATVLECSEKAIEGRLARARRRLQQALG